MAVNKLFVVGGVALTGLILFSNMGEVKQNVGQSFGGGSLQGAIADGGTTTTTTTTTTGGEGSFDLASLQSAPSFAETPTKKSNSVSTGTSVKGGIEFRNSSGKLVGVQDDVAQMSRLPNVFEQSANRAIIKTDSKKTYVAPTRKNPFTNKPIKGGGLFGLF